MNTFLIIDSLSVLTVAGQGISLVVAVALTLSLFGNRMGLVIRNWVSTHAIVLMGTVAAVATAGSLFYSEIALFAPCKDCWIQRIFMYPQVVLLGIAFFRKDKNIAWYILALSLLGGAMSAAHYIEQWGAMLNPLENDPLAPCDLSGVSCSATYIFQFGYITIPLMAGTAFGLNILGSLSVILQKMKYFERFTAKVRKE
jgi:disulfide bond formation protein DsbB